MAKPFKKLVVSFARFDKRKRPSRLFPALTWIDAMFKKGVVPHGTPKRYRASGRVAEGAPLLREYRVKSPIEGSNPSLPAIDQGTRTGCLRLLTKSSPSAGTFDSMGHA